MLKQQISMIGVPMDLGQLRRGVDMGPSAIRCAGVNERLESLCQDIEDLGDMTIGQREDEKEG
ncbi:arginase, partial [Bacillus paralicheniformis]